MSNLILKQAQEIVAGALRHARGAKFEPLAVLVLDARGVPKAFAAEDGTSLRRFEIALGKAHGALAFGLGSRELGKRAEARPQFMAAVTHAVGGMLVPVPGGVLIRDAEAPHRGCGRHIGRQFGQRRGGGAGGDRRGGADGGRGLRSSVQCVDARVERSESVGGGRWSGRDRKTEQLGPAEASRLGD